jgi:hypothetical protein
VVLTQPSAHGSAVRFCALLSSAIAATLVLVSSATAGPLPTSQVVAAVTLCRGQFNVILSDGTELRFGESDLSFKIEPAEFGAAEAVLRRSNRHPDRGVIVFTSLEALKRHVKRGC